jgi:hypothetical protein
LATLPFATVASVRPLLFEATEATGGMKGGDARELLLGRLFGIAALVRSGVVARATTTAADADALVAALLALGDRKAALREMATEVLADVVAALATQRAPHKAKKKAAAAAAAAAAAGVPHPPLAHAVATSLLATLGSRSDSPDKLALVLAVQTALPVRPHPNARPEQGLLALTRSAWHRACLWQQRCPRGHGPRRRCMSTTSGRSQRPSKCVSAGATRTHTYTQSLSCVRPCARTCSIVLWARMRRC